MARVMLCDDDPTVQKLVGEFLRREGHEVIVVKDGIDALVMLKKDRPDLLILDVMMPEVNGYDVCHNIKFDARLKGMPVLLLTSREQELDPRLGALMGIDYMHKSASSKDLMEKIGRILADHLPKK